MTFLGDIIKDTDMSVPLGSVMSAVWVRDLPHEVKFDMGIGNHFDVSNV